MILAVDPGVRGSGCSIWNEGKLVRAEYVKGSATGKRAEMWNAMAGAVWRWANQHAQKLDERGAYALSEFVCEFPTTYNGRSSKGDTRDVLDLSAVVGALCARFHEAKQKVYLPAEWKGQTPKAIHHKRAQGRLSLEEAGKVVLPAKALQHNVWDGVALGLTHLKRL